MNDPLNRRFTILKFGGTSVGDPRNWRHIERRVREGLAAREHPVLVCSAVAGATNALQGLIAAVEEAGDVEGALEHIDRLHDALAREVAVDGGALLAQERAALRALAAAGGRGSPDGWRAQLLSQGELMSTRLVTRWLTTQGLRVRWVDARDLLLAHSGLPLDEAPRRAASTLSAECLCDPSEEVQGRLLQGGYEVTVTQGFIARDAQGETVLLGRGGSDTSAAYLASILQAERLEIWTDVPGLFTSDPRRTQTARLLPRLAYDDAAVLGSLGAKVLHPRCLGPVKEAGIPLHIRWTHRPDVPGTIISGRPTALGVTAVTAREDLCLVIMRRERSWQPVGFMASVSACFERLHLSMDLVSSSNSEIRATLDLGANPSAGAQLPALQAALREVCEPEIRRDVMCISVVGRIAGGALGSIAACLSGFAAEAVHMVSHAADHSHLSFVVDRAAGATLAPVLHDALFGGGDARAALGARWSTLERAVGPAAGAPFDLGPLPPPEGGAEARR